MPPFFKGHGEPRYIQNLVWGWCKELLGPGPITPKAGAGPREKSEGSVLVLNWPILKVLGTRRSGKKKCILIGCVLKGGTKYSEGRSTGQGEREVVAAARVAWAGRRPGMKRGQHHHTRSCSEKQHTLLVLWYPFSFSGDRLVFWESLYYIRFPLMNRALEQLQGLLGRLSKSEVFCKCPHCGMQGPLLAGAIGRE